MGHPPLVIALIDMPAKNQEKSPPETNPFEGISPTGSPTSAWPEQAMLREEAKKSCENALCDELVYILDVGRRENNAGSYVPEIYLKSDIWIDVELVLLGEGNRHYTVVVESLETDSLGVSGNKIKLDLAPVRRDSSVFVEIAHGVEPPQVVEFRGTRSICRLKLTDNGDSVLGHSLKGPIESFVRIIVPDLVDGKLDVLGYDGREFGQPPNQLVETGSHAIESIPAHQRYTVGDIGEINAQNEQSIFRIFLSGKSAGIRPMEGFKLNVQSVKMTLRPIQLQIWVG